MRIRFVTLVSFILLSLNANARQLLSHLDFSQGKWEMIGVSLHNYALLPIQDDLGAFILSDTTILRKIKEEWNFDEKFQDYCEYHYALKFYKDGQLVETLRANLLCNYISLGGLSYEFSDTAFLKYRPTYKKVRWSRIRFKNLDVLQSSVYKLDGLANVYWYGDVKQYTFDGNFIVYMNDLPWNANRDSLVHAVSQRLSRTYVREDFYVQVYCWYMSEDLEKMSIRFNVYCNEDFYTHYKEDDVLARWRSHFSEQNFVQIVVIGMNQEDYYKAMREN